MAWEFNGDRPIYAQLLELFRRKIVTGEYTPGERLPSVRELAETAAVNPNTMQRALSELERTGLVYSLRTAGRYVTEDPGRIARVREELAEEVLERFLREMRALGFTPAMVREKLDRTETAERAGEARSEAAGALEPIKEEEP